MNTVRIGNRLVGSTEPVFIIAEAGVNHNGDLGIATALVREAKACGADCVKFQTFKAHRLAIERAPKADYQIETTDPRESQIAMLQKLELPAPAYTDLTGACRDEGIVFLSTPYDIEDIDFLDGLGVPAFKVASGQLVEPAFLRYVARKGKPIILSTGMATLAEVDEAVRLLRESGNTDLIVLQCTTNYPSRIEDANLRAMLTMQTAFDVQVGYSDHTQTDTACIAATALGACVIEKHFTLDKTMPGPDQSSSADPFEFRRLVKAIREAEAARGSAVKEPAGLERRNMSAMRRSIVTAMPIPKGARVEAHMLTYKRPGTGLAPGRIGEIVGRVAARNIPADTLMTLDCLQ